MYFSIIRALTFALLCIVTVLTTNFYCAVVYIFISATCVLLFESVI